MVITVDHLMSSLETRPSAKAYKISTRIESINVEASVEYSLVPIIDTCAMRGKYKGFCFYNYISKQNIIINYY